MSISGVIRVMGGVVVATGLSFAAENVSADALAKQADNALRTGEYKKAAKLWQKAIRLESTNANYREGLGRAYERQAEAASFPFFLEGKARENFVRALELQPDNAAALIGLIELNQQPIGVCEGDLNESSRLIDRLSQVNPAAARRELEYLQDAQHEAARPGQKLVCGPIKVSRVVTDHVLPPARVKSGRAVSVASVVAENQSATPVVAGTK